MCGGWRGKGLAAGERQGPAMGTVCLVVLHMCQGRDCCVCRLPFCGSDSAFMCACGRAILESKKKARTVPPPRHHRHAYPLSRDGHRSLGRALFRRETRAHAGAEGSGGRHAPWFQLDNTRAGGHADHALRSGPHTHPRGVARQTGGPTGRAGGAGSRQKKNTEPPHGMRRDARIAQQHTHGGAPDATQRYPPTRPAPIPPHLTHPLSPSPPTAPPRPSVHTNAATTRQAKRNEKRLKNRQSGPCHPPDEWPR